jgi:hypothetical protein
MVKSDNFYSDEYCIISNPYEYEYIYRLYEFNKIGCDFKGKGLGDTFWDENPVSNFLDLLIHPRSLRNFLLRGSSYKNAKDIIMNAAAKKAAR